MKLAAIKEVIKASPAIQIESRITHLQRKAWNILLANAYNELPTAETHRVNVVDLAKKLGYSSRNWDHLKSTLEALVDCKIKWNILEKDKELEWGVTSLLATARIKDGVCTYEFSPFLRTRLYNPRIYAKINLSLQNQFRCRYALILWEVCFDYFDIARNQGETPFIQVETFRTLIGLDKDEYPLFSEFNRSVIKPAIKEINDLTPFFVEVEQKRMGRNISELKFRISRVKEINNAEQTDMELLDLPSVALKLVQAGVAEKTAVRIAEQEWESVRPDALPESGTYPDFEAYIDEKIWIARRAEDVENLAGFIIQAIKENYQDAKLQKQREAEKEKEQQAMLDSLKEEMQEKRRVLLRQAVKGNPELLEKAKDKVSSWITSELLQDYETVAQAYEAGGIVTAELNHILAEEYCQDLLAPVLQSYEDEKAKIVGKED